MQKRTPLERTRRHILISAAACGLLFAAAMAPGAAIAADPWPNGAVQLIVPAKAGGGTDAAARIISAALQEKIGAPVVVVNVPSGGGTVAAEQVRLAKPDGQTLLYFHNGILTMYHTGGYEHSPVDDFTTIETMQVGGSFAVTVPADSPYQSVADLIQATKDNPNQITMGVQLRGGSHFTTGLLTMDSDAKFRIVEAGSDADKLVALQGHQINAAIINTPGAMQYVESGDLRILATVAGFPERDPNAPDYPSLSELGYKNAVFGTDFLILGPAGMDPGVVETINAAVSEVLNTPAVAEQLKNMRLPISPMGVEASQQRFVDSDKVIEKTAEILGLN